MDWNNIKIDELAAFVSELLRKEGIEAILVGGACVTIYSKNRYQSYDLDFVTFEEIKRVKKVLALGGFYEKNGYFKHQDCPYFIEFVNPPVAVGREPIHQFGQIKNRSGTIQLLRVEDCIKDRLAGYFHWDDQESLIQAIDVCLEVKANLAEVKKWAQEEGFIDKYQRFIKELKRLKSASG
ncbi:MAG: hypothetical protein H7A38_06665 [Chlamydiales bacterium]|nr:hypothetical protein [Chlamydiales bacterium]